MAECETGDKVVVIISCVTSSFPLKRSYKKSSRLYYFAIMPEGIKVILS
jgi:hypothetical protein